MADHADDDGDGDIFVYRGGRAPQHVTHALIDDKSVDEIEDYAFYCCLNLEQVDTHDGLRKIRRSAFWWCLSLRRINLKSAVDIDFGAFYNCDNLESIEFGDRLETIGTSAFSGCISLPHLTLPSVTTIGAAAFWKCKRLTDVELSERLESMGPIAFYGCERLQRIAIPAKRDLFEYSDTEEYTQFDNCEQLKTVDLVGGIHKTVASLHMDTWRAEIITEIDRINQVLSNTRADDKTVEIRQWMTSVIDKMDHYKAEHYRFVKEGITLLELALWKAKLGEKDADSSVARQREKAKIDSESARIICRKERRITCGADIVIKNVLPFLQLE